MHPSAKAANLATCEILPDASLIATTFLTSFAILTAVSGRMFVPVLEGTLYIIIGIFTASEIAL